MRRKKENEEQLKLVKTRRVQRRKSRTLALVAKHLNSMHKDFKQIKTMLTNICVMLELGNKPAPPTIPIEKCPFMRTFQWNSDIHQRYEDDDHDDCVHCKHRFMPILLVKHYRR